MSQIKQDVFTIKTNGVTKQNIGINYGSIRNIVDKNEGKLTVLQIIGFCLLIFGVVSLIISSFNNAAIIASIVSISFFITMLGFAFSFPTLLKGSDGLSTMRIVVFMVINVICMLLLKIGRANGINSLKQIGLDQYWMGVIAFVFGAKATQSFFESKMAGITTNIPADSYKNIQPTTTFKQVPVPQNGAIEHT